MTTPNYPYFEYYTHKNTNYISTFPREWLNHKPGTGPIECGLCSKYGKINQCFVGYCFSCGDYYEKTRGKGIINTPQSIPTPPYYLTIEQKQVYKVIVQTHIRTFLKNLVINSKPNAKPNAKPNTKSFKEIPLPIIAVDISYNKLTPIPEEPTNDYDWTADL